MGCYQNGNKKKKKVYKLAFCRTPEEIFLKNCSELVIAVFYVMLRVLAGGWEACFPCPRRHGEQNIKKFRSQGFKGGDFLFSVAEQKILPDP